jgi:hypothetical protein
VRYYVTSSDRTWWTIAPEVPGVASEDVPSRDEAIARCRALVAEEVDAYRRLGHPLEIEPSEEIVDWSMPWWLIPDWLVPTPPALLGAAVRRMDQIASEVERYLDGLRPGDWDRAPDEGWTIRRTLDHVAGGFEIGIRRLQPWPLDPERAHAAAFDELVARIRVAPSEPVEHSGLNTEAGRVRWTPRKVARVVRGLQEATRANVESGGPAPLSVVRHDDVPGDDEPATEAELRTLSEADAELRLIGARERRARGIAIWYRYYRDRLVRWPDEPRDRWRAMRAAYRQRLLELGETELATVRIAPSGQCSTVRMELGLGLSHVREHLAQMGSLTTATA